MRGETIVALCAALSLLSVTLIGARFVQVRVHRPVPTFQQTQSSALRPPKAYTPKRATARLARQHRKQRPPTVLGALDQTGVTRYCVATTGPLTTAELTAGTWMCRPFLGAAQPADVTAACRFLFDDPAADAKQTAAGSWRCLKNPA
jgi:hypothetical protein